MAGDYRKFAAEGPQWSGKTAKSFGTSFIERAETDASVEGIIQLSMEVIAEFDEDGRGSTNMRTNNKSGAGFEYIGDFDRYAFEDIATALALVIAMMAPR